MRKMKYKDDKIQWVYKARLCRLAVIKYDQILCRFFSNFQSLSHAEWSYEKYYNAIHFHSHQNWQSNAKICFCYYDRNFITRPRF